jgi:MFS family permease
MGAPTTETQAVNPRRWQSLAAVCMLVGLVWILSDGFIIAVPTIGRDLGGSADQLAWAVNGFSLAACLAAFFGRLGDVKGNRKILVIGSFILIVGAVIAGLSQTPDELIIGRVVQGIGGTAIFTCALSVVTIQFPLNERPKALSIRAAFGWAASGFAVLILAVLLETLGWRSIFWVVIPIALIGLGLFVVTTPEYRERRPDSKIDLLGAVTLTAAFLVLSFAMIESDEIGIAGIVGLVCGSGLLFGLFALVESRSADPLIPLSVWKRPTFTGSIVVNFVFILVLTAVLYLMSLYLQTVRDLSTVDAAFVLLGATIALIATNPLGARLVKRGRFLIPVVAGMVLVAVGCLAILAGVKADSTPIILIGLVIIGSAVGIQLTSIATLQVSSAGATKGTASGVVGVTFGVAAAMGIALATALMQNFALHSLRNATGSDQLDGVSHQHLLDVLSGSLSIDTVSAANQKVVTAAFDSGLVAANVVFAVMALLGAGLALVMLRNIALDDG